MFLPGVAVVTLGSVVGVGDVAGVVSSAHTIAVEYTRYLNIHFVLHVGVELQCNWQFYE